MTVPGIVARGYDINEAPISPTRHIPAQKPCQLPKGICFA